MINWSAMWERLGFVVVCLLCLAVFIFIGIGIKAAIMPSEFGGYYLEHGLNGYSIMAKWTNGEDVIAYKSYSAEEILTVYAALTALEEARKSIRTPVAPKMKALL